MQSNSGEGVADGRRSLGAGEVRGWKAGAEAEKAVEQAYHTGVD